MLDLSSFKCGHDAPTYGLIDSIIADSRRRPYAALHDIDANKPGGSIKIRVKTYAHSLKLHEERLEDATQAQRQLAHAIDEKRLELLELKQAQLERPQAVRTRRSSAQIEELAREAARLRAPPAAAGARAARRASCSSARRRKDGTIVPPSTRRRATNAAE